ncbi:hypothetical protein [Novosphingobium sp. ERW19]|uniref:hypothetical protein n=1 Tax=Novosphingobium sp. ERW19 TaxID=2726186 RepID=UPI0017DD4130|nr:hypothetical protein [Novosphingobium sp. ERW19]NLR39267.1 hypothetical protein [Novosphingobium sp. ERW19]
MLDENFEIAVSSGLSIEPQFVLVRVTDANSGASKSGCVAANALLGAIHREHKLGYDDRSLRTVGKLVFERPLRTFNFRSEEALANLDFARFEMANLEECALVRKGIRVWRTDTGTMMTSKDMPPPN